jgi:hypothetical protein
MRVEKGYGSLSVFIQVPTRLQNRRMSFSCVYRALLAWKREMVRICIAHGVERLGNCGTMCPYR